MPNIVIIGATRGLGLALTKSYASGGSTVYATTRSSHGPEEHKDIPGINWLSNIDVSKPEVGENVKSELAKKGVKLLDVVVSPHSHLRPKACDEPHNRIQHNTDNS